MSENVVRINGRAASRAAPARPLTRRLTDADHHRMCGWFASCHEPAEFVVPNGDNDIPVCPAHVDVITVTRDVEAMGQRRVALIEEQERLEHTISEALRDVRARHGKDVFPVSDMARLTCAARTTVLRWLSRNEKREGTTP